MKLFKKLHQSLESRRRRRAFGKIRLEFARAGYRLDHFRDSQIETALGHWNNDVSHVTINAKTIYRTLKRLERKSSLGVEERPVKPHNRRRSFHRSPPTRFLRGAADRE